MMLMRESESACGYYSKKIQTFLFSSEEKNSWRPFHGPLFDIILNNATTTYDPTISTTEKEILIGVIKK
jgi:hypothetical protein